MEIRPIEESDYPSWKVLYQGYKDFYKVEVKDQQMITAFQWILSQESIQQGLVVELESKLIGLAHYQIHPNPLSGKHRMYLNDLFIAPDHRGSGCFDLVITTLQKICVDTGLESLRWLTAHDNYRARAAYDRCSEIIPFITYQIKT